MGPSGACLLYGWPVDPAERRCPAFALAGVFAHAGCCGGCATALGGGRRGVVEALTAAMVVGESGG